MVRCRSYAQKCLKFGIFDLENIIFHLWILFCKLTLNVKSNPSVVLQIHIYKLLLLLLVVYATFNKIVEINGTNGTQFLNSCRKYFSTIPTLWIFSNHWDFSVEILCTVSSPRRVKIISNSKIGKKVCMYASA